MRSHMRAEIEKLEGVTRTWFELGVDHDGINRTLVVQVRDTDDASGEFRPALIEQIRETAKAVAAAQTPKLSAWLRIVPLVR